AAGGRDQGVDVLLRVGRDDELRGAVRRGDVGGQPVAGGVGDGVGDDDEGDADDHRDRGGDVAARVAAQRGEQDGAHQLSPLRRSAATSSSWPGSTRWAVTAPSWITTTSS